MFIACLIYSACNDLSNASGLVVPRLTQSSYETVHDVIYETHLPTIIAQNVLTNFTTTSDGVATWRSTTDELLSVIQSLLSHICPAAVVLVESMENVAISLSTVLPNILILSDDATVDVMTLQYNNNDSLVNDIASTLINVGAMINLSAVTNVKCAHNRSQSGIVLILNSPVHDMDAILTMVSFIFN